MRRSDRISAFPEDVIEKILGLMPIRDAVRTSILSRKWRYSWTRMPKLVFEDKMVNESYGNKHKLLNAIFHVLMLHKGPILEVCLWIEDEDIVNEIDQIILRLSWSKNIKRFTFECAFDGYKLPFSFFSMQGLEYLDLINCKFELPLMFNGFSMLKILYLEDVTITANMLQRVLTNCPLLDEFGLIKNAQRELDFIGRIKCTFVDLFKCLPSIRYLKITNFYMEVILNLITLYNTKILRFNSGFGIWLKHLAAGGMPQRLPTSLPQLEFLVLDVCFQKQDELSSAIWVINSSPNLECISLKVSCKGEETFNNLLDFQVYSSLNLDHLRELEITSFRNSATEMEFVKLIMAKSPVLKKARIELDASVSVDKENNMLRELLLLPLPRASPAANFIIQRPKDQIKFY